MVYSRKNRRNSRKNSRKNRRNRRNSRRNNVMYGGNQMNTPSSLNFGQGREFQEIHQNQHGGGSWIGAGAGAPVGDQGLLPQELQASARILPSLQANKEIIGMSDTASVAPAQKGGARRRRTSKKSKKSRKARKGVRKGRKLSRRQRGGAYSPSPYNAPTMLLSPAQAAKAGTADFSNPLLKY